MDIAYKEPLHKHKSIIVPHVMNIDVYTVDIIPPSPSFALPLSLCQIIAGFILSFRD